MIAKCEDCEHSHPEGIDYVRATDPDTIADELRPVVEDIWDDDSDDIFRAVGMEVRDMG